jgi:WD40 repeat protein
MFSGRCVRVFNLDTDTELNTSLAVTPDGRCLLTGGLAGFRKGVARVWDVHSGKCLRVLEGHTGAIYWLEITPDCRRLVTGSVDGTTRVWDMASGRCQQVLEADGEWRFHSFVVMPDGRRLAAGSRNGVQLWDLHSGCCICTLTEHHEERDPLMRLTPDGRHLVTCGWHRRGTAPARLWDLATRLCIRVFEGHSRTLRRLTITPGGSRLFAEAAGQVYVWDLASGELLGTLHLVDDGFLWTLPPDVEAGAPSGWLWTDRPDLVHLTEANKDGSGDPRPIPQDDQRFKDYMLAYNRQDMVMARINDPQRYKELTGRIKSRLQGDRPDAVWSRRGLPGPDSGTVPQAPPSDGQ